MLVIEKLYSCQASRNNQQATQGAYSVPFGRDDPAPSVPVWLILVQVSKCVLLICSSDKILSPKQVYVTLQHWYVSEYTPAGLMDVCSYQAAVKKNSLM